MQEPRACLCVGVKNPAGCKLSIQAQQRRCAPGRRVEGANLNLAPPQSCRGAEQHLRLHRRLQQAALPSGTAKRGKKKDKMWCLCLRCRSKVKEEDFPRLGSAGIICKHHLTVFDASSSFMQPNKRSSSPIGPSASGWLLIGRFQTVFNLRKQTQKNLICNQINEQADG